MLWSFFSLLGAADIAVRCITVALAVLWCFCVAFLPTFGWAESFPGEWDVSFGANWRRQDCRSGKLRACATGALAPIGLLVLLMQFVFAPFAGTSA